MNVVVVDASVDTDCRPPSRILLEHSRAPQKKTCETATSGDDGYSTGSAISHAVNPARCCMQSYYSQAHVQRWQRSRPDATGCFPRKYKRCLGVDTIAKAALFLIRCLVHCPGPRIESSLKRQYNEDLLSCSCKRQHNLQLQARLGFCSMIPLGMEAWRKERIEQVGVDEETSSDRPVDHLLRGRASRRSLLVSRRY